MASNREDCTRPVSLLTFCHHEGGFSHFMHESGTKYVLTGSVAGAGAVVAITAFFTENFAAQGNDEAAVCWYPDAYGREFFLLKDGMRVCTNRRYPSQAPWVFDFFYISRLTLVVEMAPAL